MVNKVNTDGKKTSILMVKIDNIDGENGYIVGIDNENGYY